MFNTLISPMNVVGGSTFAPATCFRISATDFTVEASKYDSSAASSFISSNERHGVANGVIPLVHPAYVLSPLAEKFMVLTVAMSWGVV